MNHGPPARNFRTDDDYGPGWRQAHRDSINDDVAPDDVSLLGPPTRTSRGSSPSGSLPARAGWSSERRPSDRRRSEEELAAYGYAGQGYPIYGQPSRGSGEGPDDDPAPGWFADPGSAAFSFGYTTSLRPYDSYPRTEHLGGHAGKGPRDYIRSDARVLEDVCDRLSDDDEVDASDITVSVAAGEVTLSGTVLDRYSKRRADHIAAAVRGVVDVHNRLGVQKGLLRELGDKLVGGAEHRGHHGTGPHVSEVAAPK